jgi:hypothetical protein
MVVTLGRAYYYDVPRWAQGTLRIAGAESDSPRRLMFHSHVNGRDHLGRRTLDEACPRRLAELCRIYPSTEAPARNWALDGVRVLARLRGRRSVDVLVRLPDDV